MNIVLVALVWPFPDYSASQILDPDWKSSVVVIDQQAGQKFNTIGTGIAVLFRKTIYIVTNAHVATSPNLYLRLNSKNHADPPIRLSIDSILTSGGVPIGIATDADIATIPMFHYQSMVEPFDSLELKSIGVSLFKNWDYINEGDEVYVLGFPLQIGTGTRSRPVYRYGIVSLKEKPGQYLIDCNVYPGNSGSPVFIKPSIFDYRKGNLGEITPAFFIGVVSGYLPYTDVAISAQTQRPRVTFEENSGLAIVFSADKVLELLSSFSDKYKLND